ncbi:hypothetical protein IWQ55_006485 [Labrenzia sp. EL_208]|nr:hypothetical protein [Labrenzia sp. EL_132]MBG6233247.1 hypothetical protein [Labrenzia sp. EL_208]
MVLAWIMWRDWEKVQRLSSDQVTWITFTVEMAFDVADDPGSVELFLDPSDAFTELQSKGVDGDFSAYGRHIKEGNVKAIEQGEWLCFVLDRNRSIYSLHENSGSAAYDSVNFSRDEVLRIWPPEPAANENEDHEATPLSGVSDRGRPKEIDWPPLEAVMETEIRAQGIPGKSNSNGFTTKALILIVQSTAKDGGGQVPEYETVRSRITKVRKNMQQRGVL